MVAASAMTPSLTPPNPRIGFVDPKTGLLTNGGGSGLSILQQHHQAINGLTPTISCTCSNVGNVFTLTPFNISPNLSNYFSYWSFAFVASATSGPPPSATVVPITGSLPTLPVLATHGSTTASFTNGLFYVMYYVDTLNSGNGAFVVI